MVPELSLEFIQKLPKTDLHCHLDGSLRLDTILDLARHQGVTLPTADRTGLFELIYAGDVCSSLDDYLKAFDITLSVMQTEEALERIAFELAEDAWRENVRYIEVRYAPMLHTRNGLRLTQVVEAVLRGLRTAKRELGIRYGLILCGIRSMSAESSIRMAELCIAFKNRGVVGFDLAGSEVNNPAKLHRQAFQLVIDNNINCTAHAGEAFGPDSIAQAIHKCGAHRIGHGTRLVENGDLLNYVNDHRIPLEVCPSSNLQTKAAGGLGGPPGRLLRRLRPARDDQHRQPPDDRHDRVQGDLAVPPQLRVELRPDQGHHHRGLQERVHAVSREGRSARRDQRRARRGGRSGERQADARAGDRDEGRGGRAGRRARAHHRRHAALTAVAPSAR